MNTTEAIKIIKEAIAETNGTNVQNRLQEMLDALEAQDEFNAADKSTKEILRNTITTCEAIFDLIYTGAISQQTIISAIDDARLLIAKLRASGLIV